MHPCVHHDALDTHLGTHELAVRYEERLCIFHSDDPEVVPPGCGDWELIGEGTVTLSLFQTRDLAWYLGGVLDGAASLLGPEGTTSPE